MRHYAENWMTYVCAASYSLPGARCFRIVRLLEVMQSLFVSYK